MSDEGWGGMWDDGEDADEDHDFDPQMRESWMCRECNQKEEDHRDQ